MDILKDLESSLNSATQKFNEELQGVRSNRPSVGLIEDVRVECYGEQMTVQQLGSLSIAPPRTIEISVWDATVIPLVTKAIQDTKAGVSVSNNGNIIRVSLPSLTDERREEFVKLVKKMSEAVRIQIRGLRDDANKRIKASQDAKTLSEDQAFKQKEQSQKLVDKANEKVEMLLQVKIKELSE